MQTSHWGRIKDTWSFHMFAGFEETEMILSALVLERKLPAVGKIWYAPGGFVADYRNNDLLNAFSSFMKKEMKKRKIAFFLTDPKFIWKINGQQTHQDEDVISNLKNAGYVYNTNRNNFTYEPPIDCRISLIKENGERYTEKEMMKRYDKQARYDMKVSSQRALSSVHYTYQDLVDDPQLYEDFVSVMNDTSKRIGFVTRPHDYYLHFMKELAPWAVMNLVYYDFSEDQKSYEEKEKRLSELKQNGNTPKNANRIKEEINSLEAWIRAYKQREEVMLSENQQKICAAGGITIRFGKIANNIFAGTLNLLRNNLRASYYLNQIQNEESIASQMDYHSIGGVTYDYFDESSELYGLYQFKKKLAADTIEYIGEYTLVNNPLQYSFYMHVMPWAKKNVYKIRKALHR